MVFAFRLMNDTIFLTFLTAIPMVLHRTMMFRGSLFLTRHGVDSGCRAKLLLPVESWLLSLMCEIYTGIRRKKLRRTGRELCITSFEKQGDSTKYIVIKMSAIA